MRESPPVGGRFWACLVCCNFAAKVGGLGGGGGGQSKNVFLCFWTRLVFAALQPIFQMHHYLQSLSQFWQSIFIHSDSYVEDLGTVAWIQSQNQQCLYAVYTFHLYSSSGATIKFLGNFEACKFGCSWCFSSVHIHVIHNRKNVALLA